MSKQGEWDERILALRVGMTTAAEIVRQTWGARYAQCALDYEKKWAASMAKRKTGYREMVAGDIFLPRRMMTAADLGLEL